MVTDFFSFTHILEYHAIANGDHASCQGLAVVAAGMHFHLTILHSFLHQLQRSSLQQDDLTGERNCCMSSCKIFVHIKVKSYCTYESGTVHVECTRIGTNKKSMSSLLTH